MSTDADHYEAYYADKLWGMLPAAHRAEDTDRFNAPGPLREMVDRIGAQAAVLRRGIDRLWEDQSVETCDDWVIPYIGDLLATNLVANSGERARRLDVARTIYYRRRKGTPLLLEQLAADVTGWDARVVEFFRRLGRTRHALDPALGLPVLPDDEVDRLRQAAALVGAVTRTPIGGTADVRNGYGATKAATAFDEFFHTADFRRGRGQIGWHDIPRLGVFLWRLKSFGVPPTTPVAVRGCPNWFTFDPTGRDVPLFAKASRTTGAYERDWRSPVEAQLPTPISQPLYDANRSAEPADRIAHLYPDSLAVLGPAAVAADAAQLPASSVQVRPARGRFRYAGATPLAPPDVLWATYHYGFSSEVGAGPYDRRIGRRAPPRPAPLAPAISGGGAALLAPNAIPGAGTVTLADSLTYAGATDVAVTGQLTLRADNRKRPVIRLPQPPAGVQAQWAFAGTPGETGNCLVLDGLLISGGDLVLRGDFRCVTLTCCTLDPGAAAASPPASFANAADGRPLAPTRLWIEGTIGTLIIERCITGPIQVRTPTSGGDASPARPAVGALRVTDSIIQAIPGSAPPDDPPPPAHPPDAALFLPDGSVTLDRSTILGPAVVHRLDASECILRDAFAVDDAQHGCLRFSAVADGGTLPRAYECVRITPAAPLFTSTDFGQPGYAQLLATADLAIIPEPPPPPPAVPPARQTISAGARDGSEMGAFARERGPVKQRGLLIKYQEFMPAGLVPVVVFVT